MKDPLFSLMRQNSEDTMKWPQTEMNVRLETGNEGETRYQDMLRLSVSLCSIEEAKEAGSNGYTIEELDSFLDSILD